MTDTVSNNIMNVGGGSNPIGTIISFMGNNAPDGYLFCDGTEYNIEDYPALANHFETEFGTKNYFGGDGTTTFKVPNLQGEFLRCTGTNANANQGDGGDVGEHQSEGVPNITGGLYGNARNTRLFGQGKAGTTRIDCFTVEEIKITSGNNGPAFSGGGVLGNATGNVINLWFDASQSNSIYGSSAHVTPTNTSVLYCIKY